VTSKLAPHILGTSSDGARLAREAPVLAVKLVDDFGLADELSHKFPKPLVIGRVSGANVDPGAVLGIDPKIFAQDVFDTQMSRAVILNPAVAAWEAGANEPVCKSIESMRWYAVYEAEMIRMLSALGKAAVIGNFSVGQPEPELWPEFTAALNIAQIYMSFLGLHEYGEPSRLAAWDQWYLGRFTRAPFIKTIITECGTDSVPPVPEDGTFPAVHPAGRPWRDQFGTDALGIAAYRDYLIGYDLRLQQYPQIVAACIFAFGNGGDSRWDRHDIQGSGLVDHLIAYIKSNAGTAPLPPPPEPEPEPEPPPIEPPPSTVEHYFGGRENYWVINLYKDAFGLPFYKDVIARVRVDATSTLLNMEDPLKIHVGYHGPPTVEAIPDYTPGPPPMGLTGAEKQVLINQMVASHWL